MQSIVHKEFLKNQGFSIHEIVYLGCLRHPSKEGWGCPVDHNGKCVCNKSYWEIDDLPLGKFIKKAGETSEHITYVFSENDGICRKIGEGKVEQIRANLKAHYNHGISKAKQTNCDRKDSNKIAKRCRKNKTCFLFIKPATSKEDAKRTKIKIKHDYYGWLDYDQKKVSVRR